jgi:hypothetical protein
VLSKAKFILAEKKEEKGKRESICESELKKKEICEQETWR